MSESAVGERTGSEDRGGDSRESLRTGEDRLSGEGVGVSRRREQSPVGCEQEG